MLASSYPFYLANEAVYANKELAVTDKFSGTIATHVALAHYDDINNAITAAEQAEEAMFNFPAYKRQDVLHHCVKQFNARFDELALALTIEAGKPLKDSRGEVTRLIDTFRVAAEEAVRIYGEVQPMDISARTKHYSAKTKRVPVGACSFITPFNFPLNLVAHKVAPAIAAGCPFILKPSELTPVGALIIGEILAETDLPKGAFSILPALRDEAEPFVRDARLKLLSFTGSPKVGWMLKEQAGKKKVQLELGGNAACLLDADTDIKDAVERILFGAFYQSGQSCVSVQRLIVHKSIYDTVKKELVEKTQHLKMGDPKQEETFIGAVITEKEAKRIETQVEHALERGAKSLIGGTRQKNLYPATILENVPKTEAIYCREVFGPVLLLESFSDFDEGLEIINDSTFGLQAGVFTRDIYKAEKAWNKLKVGTVIINDVPSWRVDHMPYGGVKGSGIGREGIRYSIQEMTEIRQFILRTIP